MSSTKWIDSISDCEMENESSDIFHKDKQKILRSMITNTSLGTNDKRDLRYQQGWTRDYFILFAQHFQTTIRTRTFDENGMKMSFNIRKWAERMIIFITIFDWTSLYHWVSRSHRRNIIDEQRLKFIFYSQRNTDHRYLSTFWKTISENFSIDTIRVIRLELCFVGNCQSTRSESIPHENLSGIESNSINNNYSNISLRHSKLFSDENIISSFFSSLNIHNYESLSYEIFNQLRRRSFHERSFQQSTTTPSINIKHLIHHHHHHLVNDGRRGNTTGPSRAIYRTVFPSIVQWKKWNLHFNDLGDLSFDRDLNLQRKINWIIFSNPIESLVMELHFHLLRLHQYERFLK